ncbi:agamous-like MADS-box protein AGL62 [Coffea arabica]|uniref:Agamous-like MADS-box protein AGL62 n=1 Tax=Coffea arabica TaxID=13443 RepID=A0ABM4V090_COFAR
MEATVKRKGGSGRKKIEIKKIENKNYLQATFSKRRTSLFRKAAELSATCGADVAVIVQSPGGNVFAAGGRSSVATIVDRYLAATSSTPNNADQFPQADGGGQERDQDEEQYAQILKEIEAEKIKEKSLMESQGGEGFWWERGFDDLDVNELEEYVAAMETLRKNVSAKAEEKAKANNIAAS